MDFTFTVTDAKKLAGLTAAKDAYNASQSHVEGFVPLTEQQYVEFVMNSAMESYAKNYTA